MFKHILLLLIVFLGACSPAPTTTPSNASTRQPPEATTTPQPVLRYLALGDSYTIGQSVAASESFPQQLVTSLRAKGYRIDSPDVIARTGWTSADLQAAIQKADPHGPYDLVTLLVGVNDQYRQYPIEDYPPAFEALLKKAIELTGGKPQHVIVLSIPDWGVTPFAHEYERQRIFIEIDRYNQLNQYLAQQAGAGYVDITPISRQAASDLTLLSDDKLHPSYKMYAAWVELLLPMADTALTP
jgi:lysophospholipase L1-like esterase